MRPSQVCPEPYLVVIAKVFVMSCMDNEIAGKNKMNREQYERKMRNLQSNAGNVAPGKRTKDEREPRALVANTTTAQPKPISEEVKAAYASAA